MTKEIKTDKITRLEVIDGSGRAYIKHGADEVQLSLEDDGQTLKVFVYGTAHESWGSVKDMKTVQKSKCKRKSK